MKIMVSACLAGENCKYNGGNNLNEKVLALMNKRVPAPLSGSASERNGSDRSASDRKGSDGSASDKAGKNQEREKNEKTEENEVITVCPEVMGGLPTPRIPSEIQDDVVVNRAGISVDREFRLGAQKCLEIAQREQPDLRMAKAFLWTMQNI